MGGKEARTMVAAKMTLMPARAATGKKEIGKPIEDDVRPTASEMLKLACL